MKSKEGFSPVIGQMTYLFLAEGEMVDTQLCLSSDLFDFVDMYVWMRKGIFRLLGLHQFYEYWQQFAETTQ